MFNPAFEIFAILAAFPVGWALTYHMGRAGYPQDYVERALVGPIWIAIVAIALFFGGLDMFWTNLLSGIAVTGSLARSLWEYGLRCRERAVAAEAAERARAPVRVIAIPHYANVGRTV